MENYIQYPMINSNGKEYKNSMKCIFGYRDHRDQRNESMLMFLFLFREDISIKMFMTSIEVHRHKHVS